MTDTDLSTDDSALAARIYNELPREYFNAAMSDRGFTDEMVREEINKCVYSMRDSGQIKITNTIRAFIVRIVSRIHKENRPSIKFQEDEEPLLPLPWI